MNLGEWIPQEGMIPALSIQQPWAWLIVRGLKDIENRNWQTSYRGRILIHAGKKEDTRLFHSVSGRLLKFPPYDLQEQMPQLLSDYRRGGIVGVATLVDSVTSSDNPWFYGSYGWVLCDTRPLRFVPYRGQRGLFAVAADAVKELHR